MTASEGYTKLKTRPSSKRENVNTTYAISSSTVTSAANHRGSSNTAIPIAAVRPATQSSTWPLLTGSR